MNRYCLIIYLFCLSLFAVADEDKGKFYLDKGNEQYALGKLDKAVSYYLIAAEYNEVEAMYYLGYAMYQGEGIEQDYPAAAQWFKRAANMNYPKAEYNLAFCYMNGHGVPSNYDKALKLLVSSANHGYDKAQLTLSECYENGVLVEQDLEESKRWKAKALSHQQAGGSETAEAAPVADEPAPAPVVVQPPSSGKEIKPMASTQQPQQEVTANDGPPSFDLELDGELHERNSGKVMKPSVPKMVRQQVAVAAAPAVEEAKEEERAPLVIYAPGTEPAKKAPVLKILYPGDQARFHTDVIKVKYQLLADGLEDSTKIVAMVDAVKKDTGTRAVKQANTLDIDVPNRDCTITLYAHNKVGNSEPVSIRLIRDNVAIGDLPRLFCVAVGVGDYHDEKLPPLKLSTKDAKDFADVVAKKKGLPFADVQVKLLTDQEATRNDIFEAMEWMQQEASPKDICIFFYAGHGYRDEKDRFYFIPYGGSTDKLYNCFSASDFRLIADDINCKLIVFADACYSAALMEGNRSAAATHFVEQLRRTKNGTMLFASSTSDTKSKEDPSWGNGAFTKALIEAYNGGARQQFDEGLSTQALEMFLYKEVRRITQFHQTPVFINPNGMEHFNLFTYDE